MKKLVMVITILSAALLVMAAGKLPSKGDEINKKAEELLAKMTLEEKIGQMTQVDMLALQDDADIAKYYLGSLLSGGNSDPADITPEGWLNSYNKYQAYTQQTRLKIPLIYGIDAVHGHNNVTGAVIFPHNIGLGATRNPELVEKANRAIAEEISATGMNWTFAPCIAVARDERWGRTYESFGETPELAESLGAASVRGLQGKDLSNPTSVLACAKHFLADGGTTGGDDQGNAEFDEATLRKIHLPGYIAAIKENAATVMVSYSSFNGTKMHGNKYLVTDVLKNELGFKGIVVSDWAAIDQLEGDFKSDVEISINAGLDMVMIPFGKENENSYQKFFQYLKELVEEGKVPMSRIDDAVLRILKVKFEMNLFERPLLTSKDKLASVGSKEHREIAREGVRQSLVLLKNHNHRNARGFYVLNRL
ncbi:MAG TPA: glycoside hydrolase family 3 protein [Ignavibacteriales bacterium]|nr:glycoside hydrolase family 3 protein [Ignavibacteriales bacterium]